MELKECYVVYNLFLAAWIYYDSFYYGFNRSAWACLTLIFSFITVPLYFLKSREDNENYINFFKYFGFWLGGLIVFSILISGGAVLKSINSTTIYGLNSIVFVIVLFYILPKYLMDKSRKGLVDIAEKSEVENSKILKICKVVSLIMILLSVSNFYFERTPFLEQQKQWNVDLIEKGENNYRGTKTVWDNLNDSSKKRILVDIRRTENRIKYNTHLIIEHIYNLLLDIILFASLFVLSRWVKWYLIFWLLSGLLLIPFYHATIGFDQLLYEQFSLFTFTMKMAVIAISIIIYSFYFYAGRCIFRLINIKNKEHNKSFKRDCGKKRAQTP